MPSSITAILICFLILAVGLWVLDWLIRLNTRCQFCKSKGLTWETTHSPETDVVMTRTVCPNCGHIKIVAVTS